ncbi:MAG: DUF6261 family protein [Marinifilaceae bacterium]
MIENMSFYALHRDEYFTFGKRIHGVFSGSDLDALQLTFPVNNLSNSIDMLDAALVKSSTIPLTVDVIEKDNRRDDSFLAIRFYLQACARRLKPVWRRAAELVLSTISVYGMRLHKESYSTESARLNNLITDLETKPELKEAIVTLSLTEWVAELKQAQQDFEEAEKARTVAKASTTDIKTEDACNALRKDCEFLFQYLQLNYQINPTNEYKQLIRLINEVISEFMTVIRSRKARNSKVESTEEI